LLNASVGIGGTYATGCSEATNGVVGDVGITGNSRFMHGRKAVPLVGCCQRDGTDAVVTEGDRVGGGHVNAVGSSVGT